MKKRVKVRDKFVFEDHPKRDIDFMEVSLPDHEVDNFVNKYAPTYFRRRSQDIDQLRQHEDKKQQMRDALYKAASECLTNKQFEIFILRYKGLMKEVDIAQRLGVYQGYISTVLNACKEKLKRKLGFPSRMKPRQFYKLKEIKEDRHKLKQTKKRLKARRKKRLKARRKRRLQKVTKKRRNQRTRKKHQK
ncbi:MAG: hypothetical protein V3U54_08865 [Thermodesulfobacteriota bacterium]